MQIINEDNLRKAVIDIDLVVKRNERLLEFLRVLYDLDAAVALIEEYEENTLNISRQALWEITRIEMEYNAMMNAEKMNAEQKEENNEAEEEKH